MLDFLRTLRLKWLLVRLETARSRLDRLLEVTPRYWRTATVGGGTEQLGRVCYAEARVLATKGQVKIISIDFENAMIFLQGDPRS